MGGHRMKDGGTCLWSECGGKVHIRGLCKNCYQCGLKLIKRGRGTWETFIKMGKATEAHPQTTTRVAWFLNGHGSQKVTK